MNLKKLGSISVSDKALYDSLKSRESDAYRQLGELDMQAHFVRRELEGIMRELSGILTRYVQPSEGDKVIKILANGDIVVVE